jgi:predicted nucleic acid-binding protein
MIRVYLDTCCFNRPLDDQEQLRVRLESQAILYILAHAAQGEWAIIVSNAVRAELAANGDPDRRLGAEQLAAFATEHVRTDEDVHRRGQILERMGFGVYDSLHIAYAEAGGADVLLTTDDALIRRARRLQHEVGIRVANPLTWLKERPV